MKTDEELRRLAEKRAEEMSGFYIHFTAYLLVNAMFITIWAWEGMSTFPWWIFMTFGWGIGVVAHFVGAFISPNLLDKMVEKEFRKLKENECSPTLIILKGGEYVVPLGNLTKSSAFCSKRLVSFQFSSFLRLLII